MICRITFWLHGAVLARAIAPADLPGTLQTCRRYSRPIEVAVKQSAKPTSSVGRMNATTRRDSKESRRVVAISGVGVIWEGRHPSRG